MISVWILCRVPCHTRQRDELGLFSVFSTLGDSLVFKRALDTARIADPQSAQNRFGHAEPPRGQMFD